MVLTDEEREERRRAAIAARTEPPFTNTSLEQPAWRVGWNAGYAAGVPALGEDPGLHGECQVCGTEDEHHPNCEIGQLHAQLEQVRADGIG